MSEMDKDAFLSDVEGEEKTRREEVEEGDKTWPKKPYQLIYLEWLCMVGSRLTGLDGLGVPVLESFSLTDALLVFLMAIQELIEKEISKR